MIYLCDLFQDILGRVVFFNVFLDGGHIKTA